MKVMAQGIGQALIKFYHACLTKSGNQQYILRHIICLILHWELNPLHDKHHAPLQTH